MLNPQNTLKKILAIELESMSEEIKKNFAEQGHKHTGSLVRSVGFRLEQKGTALIGIVEFNFYGQYVNTGIKAVNIPFKKGSGRKSSKYIDALISYFKRKGLSDKDAKGAAFGTAMKHKKEGMPTSASKRFSATGKRTGAVDEAIQKINPRIEQELEKQIENIVLAQIEVPFSDLQKAA